MIPTLHYLVDEIHNFALLRWDFFTVAATAFKSSTTFTFYRYHVLCTINSLIETMNSTQEVIITRPGICLEMYTDTSYIQNFVLQLYNESTQTAYRQLHIDSSRDLKTKTWKLTSYAHVSERFRTKRRLHGLSWYFYDILSTIRFVSLTLQRYTRLNYDVYSTFCVYTTILNKPCYSGNYLS